ncbi:hypothetical protein [Lactobacillus taiwanensis]|uniref:hypothetical protein n=1 Tax=Lactobacillus taiwanensis TaxID=508451 RepID=UPI00164C1502|nr:hypothetical protein [Lactobacillus taiwanensis]
MSESLSNSVSMSESLSNSVSMSDSLSNSGLLYASPTPQVWLTARLPYSACKKENLCPSLSIRES